MSYQPAQLTIADILDRVSKRFPRTNSELASLIATDLWEYITAEILGDYPYWFLFVDPGGQWPGNFPSSVAAVTAATHYATHWLDRGWLHTVKGVARYQIQAPIRGGVVYDTDPAYWYPSQVKRINFVKNFSLGGMFQADLPVYDPDRFYTDADYSSQSLPRCATLVSDGDNCWIEFNRVPDQDYIYAVSFVLQDLVSYGNANAWSNAMFEWYPEVIINAGMLYAANYFREPAAEQFYGTLFGNPQKAGGIRRGGLVEKMKRDTRNHRKQQSQTISQWRGARAAVGRGGVRYSRSPRPGRYYQPE